MMHLKKYKVSIVLPLCDFCHRPWLPQEAVVASQSYCNDCSSERRRLAAKAFGTSPIDRSKGIEAYVLPKNLKLG